MIWPEPFILASGSARRKQLLDSAGLDFSIQPAHVDDGQLDSRCMTARAWSAAMAWLKARSVMLQDLPADLRTGTVIAADTVCELDGTIIGKPASRESARDMINRFRNRSHGVTSGVCLLRADGGVRRIFTDTACVTLGDLSEDDLEAYLATGEWEGKAGGYNLMDRVDNGWPLTWSGDETTIVGLPMRQLLSMLECPDEEVSS